MKLNLFALALVLVSCSPTPSVSPAATADCEGACGQLAAIGCEEAKPSPKRGVECAEWCIDYHADDYMPPWAKCVSEATTVESVQACGLDCK